MQRLEIEHLNLNGADPESWGFIAMVQSNGFPATPPRGPYVCLDCGRDWMRSYEQCPRCDGPLRGPAEGV